ncbi:MAG: O-antigen ligase family protein [Sulfobacillus thermotolerans]|nr:O-antigen ligase family protein [Sulfobacillus thermotolerans]
MLRSESVQAWATKVLMGALVGFPIINYEFSLSFWQPFGSVWDKLVLLFLALIAWRRHRQGRRADGFAWRKYAGWYILYCAALVLVGLKYPVLALNGFSVDVEYIVLGMLLPFVVDSQDIGKYAYGMVSVSILLGVHGVFQYIMKVPIPSSWLDVGEHVRTRVFSVIRSPAELGANMEMMIPFMFAMLLYDRHRVRQWIYFLGGLCCVATLLFTYDRGSWMGFGVSMVVIAVVYERRLLIAFAGLCIIAFFIPSIHHRIADLFNFVYLIKSAQGGRVMLWQTAFNVMSRDPLFGVGLGQYGGSIAASHSLSVYSDNYYAKILGESGLVGLVLFISMHIAIVREIIVTVVRRATGRDRYIALAGLAAVCAVLVHSFVENLFEYSPTALEYFMLVGLLLLWGRTLPAPHSNSAEAFPGSA